VDLTERYLAAIRTNLPRAQADDIVAELRETLASQREEKEADLGRALSRDEEEAMIKAFGHPLMVAARYRRQQYVIGPEVFPFYIFVLRLVVSIVLAVALTIGIAGVVFSTGDIGQAIARGLGTAWEGTIISTGVITIIFAVFERYTPPGSLYEKWSPRTLPPPQRRPQSRFEMAAGLTAGAVFILWWIGLIHAPPVYVGHSGEHLEILAAAIWRQVYWPVLGVVALGMVGHAIGLFRPRWRHARLVIQFLSAVATVVILTILFNAGHWAEVAGAGLPPEKLDELRRGLDLGIRIGIVAVGVISILSAVTEGWRLFRPSEKP
jgi:hypothetical protein